MARSSIPTASELQQLAIDTARRCGVDVDAAARRRDDRLPVNGERLSSLAWTDAAAVDDAVDRARAAFLEWRTVPAPVRGALVKRLGRAARRAQGRPRHPDQPRGRQDHLRGPRRGPGDGRHLRLRGRPLPPALRPHDAVRAPRPPADGDLAPARRRRRHQRVQLPGRGLVVEHRRRPRLRRPGRLEALGADAAHLAGLPRAPRPGHRRRRRARPTFAGAARRRRRRAGARRPPRRRAAQRDRLDPDGSRRRAAGRRPVRPRRCSSSAATTPRSSARRRTSTWRRGGSCSPRPARPGSAARRCAGSSRTAVSSTSSPTGSSRRTAGCRSATRWPRAPWSGR